MAEFAEEGLTFQAVIFLVGDNGSGRFARRPALPETRGLPACGDGSSEGRGWVPGCWNDDASAMSHGEGFLALLREMVDKRGFYVMGKSEAALSLTSCLPLVGLMHELGSPIFAATSGANIIEVVEHGFPRVKWVERDCLDHWRRYLAQPDRSLRHIVA
ncbi:hypothetical protein [Saccharopolyspora endophytica]|uniref:hypothetical protein n=1 Tax=Saccharopolyspora endophytica TaxID=543886 RepID=UPI001FEBC0EA|nr:hypothetical protein [Saccharopolyspora endophytica]